MRDAVEPVARAEASADRDTFPLPWEARVKGILHDIGYSSNASYRLSSAGVNRLDGRCRTADVATYTSIRDERARVEDIQDNQGEAKCWVERLGPASNIRGLEWELYNQGEPSQQELVLLYATINPPYAGAGLVDSLLLMKSDMEQEVLTFSNLEAAGNYQERIATRLGWKGAFRETIEEIAREMSQAHAGATLGQESCSPFILPWRCQHSQK